MKGETKMTQTTIKPHFIDNVKMTRKQVAQLRKQDKRYLLKRSRWHCTNSPSKAHHWIYYDGKWHCLYCDKVRVRFNPLRKR